MATFKFNVQDTIFWVGLGLLWTPLIRRFSAIALLIIVSAAVVPFGRLDLVGHSLIIMMLVIATVDPARDAQIAPAFQKGDCRCSPRLCGGPGDLGADILKLAHGALWSPVTLRGSIGGG